MHFLWNRTAIVRERPIAPRRRGKFFLPPSAAPGFLRLDR